MANIFSKAAVGRAAVERDPAAWPPGPGGRATPYSIIGLTYRTYNQAGFEFRRGGIRDHLLRRAIYCKPGDPPHILIAKNEAFIFRTMKFYKDFRGHSRFLDMVAEDIRWPASFVGDVVVGVKNGRRSFKSEKENGRKEYLENADVAEKILCKLVDDWQLLPRQLIPAMTPEQIAERRQQWRDQIAGNPQILTRRRALKPSVADDGDGEEEERNRGRPASRPVQSAPRRSRSPAARPVPLRSRSPLPKSKAKSHDKGEEEEVVVKEEPESDGELFVRQDNDKSTPADRREFERRMDKSAGHQREMIAAARETMTAPNIPADERRQWARRFREEMNSILEGETKAEFG